jgi:hypothetical protein
MALTVSLILIAVAAWFVYKAERDRGVHGAVIEYAPNKSAFSLVANANTNGHRFRESAINLFSKIGLTGATAGKIIDYDMTTGFIFLKALPTTGKEKRYVRAEPSEAKAFHARVAYFHQDLAGEL